jgi:hypothetical protein
VVKVPRSSQAIGMTVGQKCKIGWNRHDCRALDPV